MCILVISSVTVEAVRSRQAECTKLFRGTEQFGGSNELFADLGFLFRAEISVDIRRHPGESSIGRDILGNIIRINLVERVIRCHDLII